MEDDHNLLAILGPTNTGKTYLAFDRLISYKSGIFGFPLRLLARENYDKAVLRLGFQKVALITGEEKIHPKDAKYFFCTVESMPLNIEVECVAIDEVQMAADYERGHIFTDRVLNLRGTFETIFLGSSTIEKILINLFPKINIQKRNRFSKLLYKAKNSLSKLNPRTAIIAFNINSVYEIAETIRMHKGGAAVVLGSLSPRTRNAQVQVYEENKVDYLVATDAIGMGLNLNINHVSFSALQKFDGRYTRNLLAAELGQIAGRAGRYLNDGSFSYLKNAGHIDPLITQSIENHNFEHIKKIYWRNSNINFNSINSVIDSFKMFPVKSFFIHKKNAEDEINFRALSKDKDIIKYLNNSKTISLLWDICRIPDFQKIFNDSYLDLLKNIFLKLIKNEGFLDEEWLRQKILRLENYLGGIEELSIKIASIRTWTYIANQSKWIQNSQFWQEKTRQIENNLSDHMHKSLTNRFIDFSASYFVMSQNLGEKAIIDIDENKSIILNRQKYGYINGFGLQLNIPKSESLFSLTHIKKSIRSMIDEKINNFLKAPNDSINIEEKKKKKFNEEIKVCWGDEPIAKLTKGKNIFSPNVETYNTEFLDSDKKILITKKIQLYLDEKISETLNPITKLIDDSISSDARSIIFNVFNELGTILISEHYNTIKNIGTHDKVSISRAGIRIGAKFFFMPNLLKKFSMELKAMLWKVYNEPNLENLFPLPNDGRVSFVTEIEMPNSYWSAIGYHCLNNFAIRVDVFERIFYLARKKIKYGPFIDSPDLMNPIGCNSDQLKNVLKYCGFESLNLSETKKLFFYKQNKEKKSINLQNKEKKSINLQNKEKKSINLQNKEKKSINLQNIKKKSINLQNKKKQTINLQNKEKTKEKKIKNNTSIKKNQPELTRQKIQKENVADPNSPFAVLKKLL